MVHISPTSARKLAAQETRNQIIKSYGELVREKGTESITIRDICRKAGVSNGGFYNHFSSKNDVVRAWYLQFTTGVAEKIRKSGAATAEEEILIYYDGYAELNMQLGTEFCRHFYTGTNEFLGSHNYESLDVIFKITQRFLNEISKRDSLRAENIVRYFLMISRGVMLEWAVKNGDFDARSKMRSLISVAIAAIKSGQLD